MNAIHLDELVSKRAVAKAAEEAAVKARREIDDQIVEAIGHVDEGTLNQVVAGKRVIVTYSVTREVKKADWPELQRIWALMPPNVKACFREVPPEVAVRNYKDLQTTEPISFGIISKLVTAKPNRPSITIEDFTPAA